jgi:hypothetical protein
MVKDRAAFRNFLATLPEIAGVRILTVSHGDPIIGGDITTKLKDATH